MRKIITSDAYQLSSRYEGTWKPEYEKLFARKFVRRLWGEEVMDAIVQTSNLPNTQLNVAGLGRLSWAMQLPDTFRIPAEPLGSFLDSFLRGNRIQEDRRLDGSVPQVLNLMNDAFVLTRTRASGTGDTASLARQLLGRYSAASRAKTPIPKASRTDRPRTCSRFPVMKPIATSTSFPSIRISFRSNNTSATPRNIST